MIASGQTFGGDPLVVRCETDVERPNRGWIAHEFSAWTNTTKRGFLRIAHIPKTEMERHLPTAWHHMTSISGRHLPHLFKARHDTAQWPDQDSATWKTFLKALSLHIRLPYPYPTSLSDLEHALVSERHPFWIKAVRNFKTFRNWHENKPMVAYVSTQDSSQNGITGDHSRQGVALTLYAAAAHWLAPQRLSLWASDLQSPEAKRLWSLFDEQGWTKTVKSRRHLIARRMPPPDAVTQIPFTTRPQEAA